MRICMCMHACVRVHMLCVCMGVCVCVCVYVHIHVCTAGTCRLHLVIFELEQAQCHQLEAKDHT